MVVVGRTDASAATRHHVDFATEVGDVLVGVELVAAAEHAGDGGHVG